MASGFRCSQGCEAVISPAFIPYGFVLADGECWVEGEALSFVSMEQELLFYASVAREYLYSDVKQVNGVSRRFVVSDGRLSVAAFAYLMAFQRRHGPKAWPGAGALGDFFDAHVMEMGGWFTDGQAARVRQKLLMLPRVLSGVCSVGARSLCFLTGGVPPGVVSV